MVIFMSVELSTSFIVMDTKLFTKHRNLEIVLFLDFIQIC